MNLKMAKQPPHGVIFLIDGFFYLFKRNIVLLTKKKNIIIITGRGRRKSGEQSSTTSKTEDRIRSKQNQHNQQQSVTTGAINGDSNLSGGLPVGLAQDSSDLEVLDWTRAWEQQQQQTNNRRGTGNHHYSETTTSMQLDGRQIIDRRLDSPPRTRINEVSPFSK